MNIFILYAIIGMLVAIRSGWMSGEDIAIAKASKNPNASRARCATVNCIYDAIMWPAVVGAILGEIILARRIAQATQTPDSRVQLLR